MKRVITVAAGAAAAVSMSQASASIVDFPTPTSTSNNVPVVFDVNQDGIDDLQLSWTYYSGYYSSSGDLWASGLNGSVITAGAPLVYGDQIDDSINFDTTNHLANYDYSYWTSCYYRGGCHSSSSVSYTGTWNDGSSPINGYLGFDINVGGQDYYGWMDITMYSSGYSVINEFAYENYAGAPILAGHTTSSYPDASVVPEPSPLALLTLGVLGIAGFRAGRKALAQHA